jgi:hypothetical protein
VPRKASWALIIWTGLMGLWAATGLSSTNDACSSDRNVYCEAGATIGRGLGLTFLALVWFVGFLILGVIWLATRPQRRLCPVCGNQVKKGVVVCSRCGFDFRAANGMPPAPPRPVGPPLGWGGQPPQMPPTAMGQQPPQMPPTAMGQQPPQVPPTALDQQPPSPPAEGPPPGWGPPPSQ